MVNEMVPSFTLDDISGREWYKDILRQCIPAPGLDEFLLLDSFQPVVLCGRPGCGKRTLAVGYAGFAYSKGVKCLYLNGSDLPEDLPGIRRELRHQMEEAGKTHTVIVLEACGRESVWEALSRECEDPPSDCAVCWIMVEDEERFLLTPWASEMLLLHVTPPDQKEREVFFSLDENRLMRRMDEKGEKCPSFSWLARQTEGMTYRDLKQVIFLIRRWLKGRVMREYGGDVSLLIDQGLSTGRFYYTEKVFLEIAERVRKSSMAAAPLQMHSAAVSAAEAPFDKAGADSGGIEIPDAEGIQSEDELAMQDVLAMIRPRT